MDSLSQEIRPCLNAVDKQSSLSVKTKEAIPMPSYSTNSALVQGHVPTSDTETKKLAPYKAYFKYRSSSMKGKLPISGYGAMHKFVHGEWEKYSPAEQEAWRISEAQLRDLIRMPPGN